MAVVLVVVCRRPEEPAWSCMRMCIRRSGCSGSHAGGVVASRPCMLIRPRWDVEHVSQAEAIIFEALGFGKMESYPAWFVAFNARCERLGVAPGGLVQKELSRTANPNPNPNPDP